MNKLLLDKLYILKDIWCVSEMNHKAYEKICVESNKAKKEYEEKDRDRSFIKEVVPKSTIFFWSPLFIAFCAAIIGLLSYPLNLFIHLFTKGTSFKFHIITCWVCIGLAVLGTIAFIVSTVSENKVAKRDNPKLLEEHETAVKALKDKELHLITKEKEVFDNYQKASKAFNIGIESGFLYKKYQNIVAICQFIEYLESGRCEELEGPDGCYNLYEAELRQNIIIEKLDQILDNQTKMIEVLNQINTKSSLIAAGIIELNVNMLEVKENTSRIACCTDIIEGKLSFADNQIESIRRRLE